jgi:hypothetical protein
MALNAFQEPVITFKIYIYHFTFFIKTLIHCQH